jgi:hypothetical protein
MRRLLSIEEHYTCTADEFRPSGGEQLVDRE